MFEIELNISRFVCTPFCGCGSFGNTVLETRIYFIEFGLSTPSPTFLAKCIYREREGEGASKFSKAIRERP
jgi:hypothetical protein